MRLDRLLFCLILMVFAFAPLAHAAANADVAAAANTDASETANDTTTDLRCLWHIGQTSRYRAVATHVTTVRTQGQPETHSNTLQIKTEFTWKVIRANPTGGGTCSMTFDNMAIALAGPDGKAEIITADKAPEKLQPLSQFIKAHTGSTITVTVAPDGEVTDAAGWQSIKSNSGEVGKNLVEQDFIKAAWELAPLAGGPADAEPGAHWTAPLDIDHEMGTLHTTGSYKFEGVEPMADIPVAIIDRTSKLSLDTDTSRLNLPPNTTVQVDMKKGEMNSQIMFDLSRHEIAGQNIDRVELFLLTFSRSGRTVQQARQERYNTQVLRIDED